MGGKNTFTYTSILTDCDYSKNGDYFAIGTENGEILIYNGTNRNNTLLSVRNRGTG